MCFTIELHFESFFTNRYEWFLITYYYNVVDSFSSVTNPGVGDAGLSILSVSVYVWTRSVSWFFLPLSIVVYSSVLQLVYRKARMQVLSYHCCWSRAGRIHILILALVLTELVALDWTRSSPLSQLFSNLPSVIGPLKPKWLQHNLCFCWSFFLHRKAGEHLWLFRISLLYPRTSEGFSDSSNTLVPKSTDV